MALDISSLPPAAAPLPPPPSRLLWAVVFLGSTLAGAVFMLLIWPRRLATGTPLFWVWVVAIPAVASAAIVLVRYALHAGVVRRAQSWDIVQQEVTASAYQRESAPIAVLSVARRISMDDEQNALSRIVSGELQLVPQATPDRVAVIAARWLDAPSLPPGTEPTQYDAARQDALLETLFASLLKETAEQVDNLPENLPLAVKVYVTAPSARIDVQERFGRAWTQRGLRKATIDIVSKAPDMMALDTWLDETGQAREHATLLVMIGLNNLVSQHPPKNSAETALALLMAPDDVIERAKLQPMARIYRPRQGVLAELAQTLELAMKWGDATVAEIHHVWHCGFDKNGQETLKSTMNERGIDVANGEHGLDQAVGDVGFVTPWLALACACELAHTYGATQLVARHSSPHAVLSIVRPVIRSTHSAGL
jgi:hypothetical protein